MLCQRIKYTPLVDVDLLLFRRFRILEIENGRVMTQNKFPPHPSLHPRATYDLRKSRGRIGLKAAHVQ
ncbi:hypothetical protein NECAME_02421 [Necator americanus]|uniref:Uncharacterized protein n=1 Tax=Necator americanus TaxID=51031 RepID=W2TFD7_NECAM|nr:hypothetical protein NECAME_02421 [Necator americanus]ETN80289.1 hypothetical protein NECAME_02421 [Necator americanus]